ncbi:MAG: uroporphyrinogen decarboxylase [Proteobacteria bacterium]|nr:uroporphyrinogen decarboxylase [Pseudomonadota bacterium]
MESKFRFIKALKRQAVDSTPVWMMRQAGRYLPEYRAVREKMGGFLAMCKTPEVACQITLQPLKRFDLDAAIIFSDILTIPDAMGLGLKFQTNEGPYFENPVRTAADINNLVLPDMEQDLGYVMQAVRLVAHELKDKAPLIGFCGSPWTVATYMVEGKSSKQFSVIKAMMYQESALLSALLDKITKASCHYLHAQIAAGVNAVMVFDTWGGILANDCYQPFSLHYMNQIVQYLKSQPQTKDTPILLFTKNGGQYLEKIAQTGCDAIGIDWTVDIKKAKAQVGQSVALQGNLDPCVLYANPKVIEAEVKKIMQVFGQSPGHIFNLGHGIYPDINPEHVQAMIAAVRKYSALQRGNEHEP